MLSLRLAERRDSFFVWQLAMREDVRAVSTRGDYFTFDQHTEWYDRRLGDSLILIVEEDGEPCGYVRWGNGPDGLEVSIAIIPEYRKCGIGRWALTMSEKWAADRWPGRDLLALVLTSNLPSWHLFSSSGYRDIGKIERMGKTHWLFWKRAPAILPVDASGARTEAESHGA